MSVSDEIINHQIEEGNLCKFGSKVKSLHKNISTHYGFFKKSDTKDFENGKKYESYSLKEMEGYPIVTSNDEYGYNLILIKYILRQIRPTDIYIPEKLSNAYMYLDGSNALAIAPMYFIDNPNYDDLNIYKLKRANQTLNKFW